MTFKLVVGKFQLEVQVDRYVLLYTLGAGAAIISAVSNVRF